MNRVFWEHSIFLLVQNISKGSELAQRLVKVSKNTATCGGGFNGKIFVFSYSSFVAIALSLIGCENSWSHENGE